MNRKTILAVTGALIAGAVLAVALLWLGGWLANHDAAPKPSAGTAAADSVTVDPDEAGQSGIVVAPLAAVAAQASSQALASVVDAASLADLSGKAAAADALWRAALARSAASGAAMTRDRALYADNRNVSQVELEGAQAAATADRAAADAAKAGFDAAVAALRQQFGPVIGHWPPGPLGRDLTAGRQALLAVATPVLLTQPPQSIVVDPGNGHRLTARYLSAALQVDPRVQGGSYFYAAPAAPSLLAGASLAVALPQGPQLRGALVPIDAVIVWQGQAWAYRQVGKGMFRRVAVTTQTPVAGGYLDSSLAAGTPLVVRGAQLLLSKELQPPPGDAPAGDGDD